MTVKIPENFMDLVRNPALALVATILKDGSPHVTPMWFDYDGHFVRVNSVKGRVKDRNMRDRPQVALCVVDPRNPFRYLEIRGHVAEITEEGAAEHIDALARKYMNVEKYPHHSPAEVRVLYRIAPDHISTLG